MVVNRDEALNQKDPSRANCEKDCTSPAPTRSIQVERRSGFPVHVTARYFSLSKGRDTVGTGHSLSLSRKDLLFRSEHPAKPELSVGTRLEVILEWPFLLNEAAAFELVVIGPVLWCENSTVAVWIERYQLRTIKRKPESVSDLEQAANRRSIQRL